MEVTSGPLNLLYLTTLSEKSKALRPDVNYLFM